MIPYPYTTPQFLTDDRFVYYGGQTGVSTPAQRQSAYYIAEKQMTRYLGQYMLPTTYTGTYFVDQDVNPFVLQLGNIRSIDRVMFRYVCNSGEVHEVGGINQLRDAYAGFADLWPSGGFRYGHPHYGCSRVGPYNVEVTTTSGLDTGTSMTSDELFMGLAAAADLVLNEMLDPGGNEAQVGIIAWSSLRYSERRVNLRSTPFGSSARANYIADLVEGFKVRRVGRF